jgi:hypothetical protein
VLQYNPAEIFQEVFQGQQVVVIDEYQEPKLKYSELNRMCDGTFQYCRKGASAVMLDKPLIIVMSNKCID